MGRGGYESWTANLVKGLQDPWERSKFVGQKISELRKSYIVLTDEQRAKLAKQAEVELRTGLEMMGKDKKTIRELIALVDPPNK